MLQPNQMKNNEAMVKEKNLATLFHNRAYLYAQQPFMAYKKHEQWLWISWEETRKYVEELGLGLISMDITRGDKIALLSENRPEWIMMDLAILSIGAVSVPIYCTSTFHQIQNIVNHAQVKAVFVSDSLKAVELQQEIKKTPSLKQIFCFEKSEFSLSSKNISDLDELISKGKTILAKIFYERMEQVDTDAPATLMYTSGTSGEQKGVLLSHKNILSNCIASCSVIPISTKDTFLSVLPLSHALERTAGIFCMMYVGGKIAFAQNMSQMAKNLEEIHPTVLICVPRILEKIYAQIEEKVHQKPKFLQNMFYKVCFPCEKKKKNLAYFFQRIVMEWLCYKQVRKRLGGKIRFIVSGGATLPSKLAWFFQLAGLQILEGYGLTETSPIVSVNLPFKTKIGSVGKPLPNVEVKISPEGEILIRGDNVMQEYYLDPAATKEAIDSDHFFHSGDIGELDSNGFLHITDRKKDIIITSSGKNIAPQPLENELLVNSLIDQIYIVGEGRHYLTALIVPNFSAIHQKGSTNDCSQKQTPEELIMDKTVLSWFEKIIHDFNSKLPSYQTIKKFTLLPKPFSIQETEITATYKLRRKVINQHYEQIINKMYNEQKQ